MHYGDALAHDRASTLRRMEKKRTIVARGAKQVNVRLPDGLHERIKAAADIEGRSINTEVVRRLERSLDDTDAADEFREYLQDEFDSLRRELAAMRELMARKR